MYRSWPLPAGAKDTHESVPAAGSGTGTEGEENQVLMGWKGESAASCPEVLQLKVLVLAVVLPCGRVCTEQPARLGLSKEDGSAAGP